MLRSVLKSTIQSCIRRSHFVLVAIGVSACAGTDAFSTDRPETDLAEDLYFELFDALPNGGGDADRVTESFSACGELDYVNAEEFVDETEFKRDTVVEIWSPRTVQLQWKSEDEISKAKYLGAEVRPGDLAGTRWCSGAVIDVEKRLVLTAAHCFRPSTKDRKKTPWVTAASIQDVKDKALPAGELAKLMTVNFNYRGKSLEVAESNEKKFDITSIVENGFSDTSKQLDFAIIQLHEAAGDTLRRVGAFQLSDSEFSPSKKVLMLQHPAGEPQKVMTGDTVDPLYGHPTSRIFYYNLDTVFGSSGAPVISRDGKVVGVHIKAGCLKSGLSKYYANSAEALSEVSSYSQRIRELSSGADL